MADTVENLILDLLEWVGRRGRTYEETMAAWRTSCPRLPVWEDATDRGLVERVCEDREWLVRVTADGFALLLEKRPHSPHSDHPMPDNDPSLYHRLGGVYHIAAIADDLVDRLMDNPALNANPAIDEAHHRLPKAGFKYLVTEMVCWATGGPQKYTGKNMRESHEHLAITEAEWQVFLNDLQSSLDRFNVPPAEQRELFAIVATTKGDIVIG